MFSLIFVSLLASADLSKGQKLRRDGKLDEAIQFFQTAPADDLDAQRELGHALTLAGRYPEALAAYRALGASAEPSRERESARFTGFTLLYLGEMEQALQALEREAEIAAAIGDKAAQVHATWYRGHVLTELSDFGRASTAFLQALVIDPQDLNTLHLFGVMAARQGDTGSLRYQIEDLKALVEKTPGAAREGQMRRVHHLEAERELLRQKPREAARLAREANRLFPHPLYRETIARAEIAQGAPDRAAAAFRDIINATDGRLDIPMHYVKSLFGLAKVLDGQGKKEDAAAAYERFLTHWGKNPSLPGVAEARERLQALRSGS